METFLNPFPISGFFVWFNDHRTRRDVWLVNCDSQDHIIYRQLAWVENYHGVFDCFPIRGQLYALWKTSGAKSNSFEFRYTNAATGINDNNHSVITSQRGLKNENVTPCATARLIAKDKVWRNYETPEDRSTPTEKHYNCRKFAPLRLGKSKPFFGLQP